MNKKFKRNNKKMHDSQHLEMLIKVREEEVISSHCDPDGKVIFLNKTITPVWLIDKLNSHFTSDRNEGVKCWGLSL